MMYVGIPDKILVNWLKGKDYIAVADEGEALAIAAGYYYALKKRATVFMSADGFANALNAFTSLVMPYKVKMNIVISIGRTEPQHIVMTEKIKPILTELAYDSKAIKIIFITKDGEN